MGQPQRPQGPSLGLVPDNEWRASWWCQVALFVFGYLRGSYLAAIALGTCTWLLMTPGHEGEWQWRMWIFVWWG